MTTPILWNSVTICAMLLFNYFAQIELNNVNKRLDKTNEILERILKQQETNNIKKVI